MSVSAAIKKSANDIMSKSLVHISSEQSLQDAHILMEQKGIHHLLVVDKMGSLIGVLSDRDIKKFASPFAGSKLESPKDRATLTMKVGTIVLQKPITVNPSSSLKECIELMLRKSIHSLPVVDENGRMLGIVTSTNIMRFFLSFV
jgi:acetoin utilization protein AcuB